MAIYRTENMVPLSQISPELRLRNQVVLNGTDDSFNVDNGIFVLIFLEAAAAVTLSDGDGNTICQLTNFSSDHVGLRCDKGIAITGTVRSAIGFFIQDCLS